MKMGAEEVSSILYNGDIYIGEVSIYPQYEDTELMSTIKNEIRISYFSSPSKRCLPLVVLHSIASSGVCFKMKPKEQQSQPGQTNLNSLYNACLQEAKTAVVLVGGNELHLVPMSSGDGQNQLPCFWGFNVVSGLYASCLGMLNLRCLAIVFDLDETLVVANTMRSFEDRIEILRRKMFEEVDPQRVSGLSAEIKRYQEDRAILKQYIESDQVCDNGKFIKAQLEVVPPPSDSHAPVMRPVIRWNERDTILTRINPKIRDTSVLVRLRPAWEDLKNYLIAKGRKRFEVYICTMSERDYALEMWRLLDPEASLISHNELLDRIVCVKPGFKKSLLNVFRSGICHPKIAMVIDDRLKVWEDRDQSRVHVVPAFAPYYAPLEEKGQPVPILCIARNVACNVRGGFFKDFDEGLSQTMARILYETDVADLPSAPDVSNYLLREDEAAIANGNTDLPVPEGMIYAESERGLKHDENVVPKSSAACVVMDAQDTKALMAPFQQEQPSVSPPSDSQSQPHDKDLEHSHGVPPIESSHSITVGASEASVDGSPGREEGEIPECELDPDTRRRLLILQHGQDNGVHNSNSADPPSSLRFIPQRSPQLNQHPFGWVGAEEKICPQLIKSSQGLAFRPEAQTIDTVHSTNNSYYGGPEYPNGVDRHNCDSRRGLPKEGFRVNNKQRREFMFRDYSSFPGNRTPQPGFIASGGGNSYNRNTEVLCGRGEQLSLRETKNSIGLVGRPSTGDIQVASTSEQTVSVQHRLDDNRKGSCNPVVALKELCTKEGLSLVFKNPPPNEAANIGESHAEVEVAGQILGKSISPTWEAAKLQAAEEALENIKPMINQCAQKRLGSTRVAQHQSNKRIKPTGLL